MIFVDSNVDEFCFGVFTDFCFAEGRVVIR